jgi:hypothetical protein
MDREKRSADLSQRIVNVAIDNPERAEEVLTAFGARLNPVSESQFQMIGYRLAESSMPENNPDVVVRLMTAVLKPSMPSLHLTSAATRILSRLRAGDPSIVATTEYKTLLRTGWFDEE